MGEFCDIHIERTIKAQGGCERGYDLCQEPVQVRVGGSFDVKIPPANIVQSFVVIHDSDISVFQERMHAEHRVVGLDDCGGNLRACPRPKYGKLIRRFIFLFLGFIIVFLFSRALIT